MADFGDMLRRAWRVWNVVDALTALATTVWSLPIWVIGAVAVVWAYLSGLGDLPAWAVVLVCIAVVLLSAALTLGFMFLRHYRQFVELGAVELPDGEPPSAERDTWLQDAVFYAVHGRWLGETDTALDREGDINRASLCLTIIRQMASDGDLQIWGKRTYSGVFEKVPAEFWIDNQVDMLSLMKGDPELVETETTSLQSSSDRYYGLKVSRAEIEAVDWRQVHGRGDSGA